MSNAMPKPWAVEDFLAWEAQQEQRYEFIDGVIFPRMPETIRHTLIKGNAFSIFRCGLRAPFQAFTSGPKVLTATEVLYPDLLVSSERIEMMDDRIREPVAILEVLSSITADHDRGRKWLAYRQLPSLRFYLLVAQNQRRVDLYTRTADQWSGYEVIESPARSVPLAELGVELDFDELYEGSGV